MDCDLGCSANALRDCHFSQPSLILPPTSGITLCFAHGSFLSHSNSTVAKHRNGYKWRSPRTLNNPGVHRSIIACWCLLIKKSLLNFMWSLLFAVTVRLWSCHLSCNPKAGCDYCGKRREIFYFKTFVQDISHSTTAMREKAPWFTQQVVFVLAHGSRHL